MIYFISDVLRC